MKVTILGAGNWGTTFAIHAHRSGHEVTLWEFDAEQASTVSDTRENRKYLPGYAIPTSIRITSELRSALSETELILAAIPAQSFRALLRMNGDFPSGVALVSLMKGIEQESLARMSEVCGREIRNFAPENFAVLSGPTIAAEVAAGLPTSAVVASHSLPTAETVQRAFSTHEFRLYTSEDIIGVELAGALKNVIALAAGICDGMKLGYNTKGTVVTRGLVEMTRLGEALGGKRSTFVGLSGLGDLVTTCSATQSRNRTVGERIGRGEHLRDILNDMVMVAEGVWTARAAQKLACQHGVDVPITDAVCSVLFADKSPREAVRELMVRTLKSEN